MYGLFQTAFYFGYMAVFSLSLGILCGTIGYMGTRWVSQSSTLKCSPLLLVQLQGGSALIGRELQSVVMLLRHYAIKNQREPVGF